MASFPSAINIPDLYYLRDMVKEDLVAALNSVPGMKDLVLESELMKPLDRIGGSSVFKENDVDKIFRLEPARNVQGSNQRIYMLRPKVALVQYIADQINLDLKNQISRTYRIIFVPRKLHACELILEQEGVYGHVTFDELPLDFIPLDKDLLSLELPEFFRSFYLHWLRYVQYFLKSLTKPAVAGTGQPLQALQGLPRQYDGDQSWCHTAARGLVTIQQYFGLIPNVYGQGKCARMVHDLTSMIFDQVGEPDSLKSQIGHLFIFDRNVDYVTPLCSQVTYEGLLDDTFTIQSGCVEFGPDVTGKDQKMKLLLTSQDVVFEEIRDRHISNVAGYLSAKAKELQSNYDKRHDLTSVSAMKDFVSSELKQLKAQHRSLQLHIGACEVIMKNKTKGDFELQMQTEHSLLESTDTKENIAYIEELINKQGDYLTAIRLLCLLSLTHSGLASQTYKFMKTQFLHSYGFEHMMTWFNLQKLGLLVEQDLPQAKQLSKVAAAVNLHRPSQYKAISKKLSLVPQSAAEINLRNPNDMSYVFSGAYTPLIGKLVDQVLAKEGYAGLEDIMKHLPGPNFSKIRAKSVKRGAAEQSNYLRVVLVYFLGGCTYSEIAALRYLGRVRGYKFIIATTAIINGTSLIRQMIEE